MVLENDPEHVERLPLEEVGARIDGYQRWHRRVVEGDGYPQSEPEVVLQREQADDHLEANPAKAQVGDCGQVDQHCEAGPARRQGEVAQAVLRHDRRVLLTRASPLDVCELREKTCQDGLFRKWVLQRRAGLFPGLCFVHLLVGHQRVISPDMILFCSVRIPWISDCGPGGEPGTYTSTGTIWSTPCTRAELLKMPPGDGPAP